MIDWQCNITATDIYDLVYITNDFNLEDIFDEAVL